MGAAQQQEPVIWTPNRGGQHMFVTCPFDEVLFHGTRGAAKTDGLLMSFARYADRGLGGAWRGILFRQTYKQLADVVWKTRKWFRSVFPRAKLNESDMVWRWPDGEELLLRYMRAPADYWEYHGHEFPWIGWEELTTWATDDCYTLMMACSRSSDLPSDIPRQIRATTNSWGVGHAWVKQRFIDIAPVGVPVATVSKHPYTGEEIKKRRTHIFGHYRENPHLIEADPAYVAMLKSIKDENLRKAWDEGSWDIQAGGYFAFVFDRATHVLPNFTPPAAWKWFPAFDWGSAAPFSLGLWTEADGATGVEIPGRKGEWVPPKGAKIRFDEWYGQRAEGTNEGLKLTNDQLAKGIKTRLDQWQERIGRRWTVGVADPSIFNEQGGPSINAQMSAAIGGLHLWDKGDNSRKPGWQALVDQLTGDEDRGPMMFFCERCVNLIRTISIVPRDPKDLDDVDTDSEDHAVDEARYTAMRKARIIQMKKLKGF